MQQNTIAIIGLGYVGMPLACEFSKQYTVLGFDINAQRIQQLTQGIDNTREVEEELLLSVLITEKEFSSSKTGFLPTQDQKPLQQANIYIITVPTPIDKYKKPDLTPLISATNIVAKYLKKGDYVIYESTTYPGCTEEDCVPLLEEQSGLTYNQDFFVGYSPERINPGDKINTLTKIKKVTSGSTPEAADFVDKLYASIIKAGTFKASSIKVAEASKAIENAQRDVNISFVNELSIIFDRIGIDTHEVLAAAGTKWNFLKFKPGLVGGHCIGVDPYYLAHKSEELGYHPAVILSGRRVNDQMGSFVASKVVKLMIQKGITIKNAKVLILGITFKENCPDIRNTKVVDIYTELKEFGCEVDVYDPWADAQQVNHEFNIHLTKNLGNQYNAIILTVAHDEFNALEVSELRANHCVIFDTKAFWPKDKVDARL